MTVIRDASAFRAFALAGNATFTVTSLRTETRLTFRVRKAKNEERGLRYFAAVLSGPNNESDYTFSGSIVPRSNSVVPAFYAGRETTEESASIRALRFLCERVLASDVETVPDGIELRHEGRCGRCARKLTDPVSIDRGIGPECFGKL